MIGFQHKLMSIPKQIFLLLLILCLLFGGCKHRSSITQLPPLEDPKVIEGEWFLEIEEFVKGDGEPTPRLFIKLYQSGEAEYDDGLLRKTFQLSETQKNEIIKIISLDDFQSAKNQYKAIRIYTDIVTEPILRFKNKQGQIKTIKITNLTLNHPKAHTFYPESLSRLFEKIDDAYPKYSRSHRN